MKMQASSNTNTAVSSSPATVSTPVIGDDYVLVRKSSILNEKKQERKEEKKNLSDTILFGLGKTLFSRAGGSFGAVNCRLTYDFSFTPTTSGTVQTAIALAPSQDASFTSYWCKLFSLMRMNSAEVQFDFTEFTSTVGHDVALSPVVLGYANTFATTQYYADVSDWKTSRFAAYSLAKPVVRYKVPKGWLVPWSTGQEASNVGNALNDWAPTQYVAATLHRGFVHFASQKVMFDTERVVVGRLIMNMTLKGQL